MNIAVILAGGSGQRMKMEIPKQFVFVKGKPVIIYTMEAFQFHPNIDAIWVVCIQGWEEILKGYARQFGISKLEDVVIGGQNGQESAYNAAKALADKYTDEDIVLLHDANRPLLSQEVISDSLVQCQKYGVAVSGIPCTEPLFVREEDNSAHRCLPRDMLIRTQTPHTLSLKKLLWAHEEALRRGIKNSIATGTILIELGEEVHLAIGSELNFKLTTQEDLELFRARLDLNRGDSYVR